MNPSEMHEIMTATLERDEAIARLLATADALTGENGRLKNGFVETEQGVVPMEYILHLKTQNRRYRTALERLSKDVARTRREIRDIAREALEVRGE